MSGKALIIGGGAAGMFCAVCLARGGVECTVLEKNPSTGKKMMITGKGRCNVTNNCDVDTVIKNIPRNPKFMYSALHNFSPKDTMKFFEDLGVELKTERGNRVFPVSDKAATIVNALQHEMKRLGVRVLKEHVKDISLKDGTKIVTTDKDTHFSQNVVIATGGKSYPATGSTGDGYILAQKLGHTVTDIAPALVPLVTRGGEAAQMMGLSLKNVILTLTDIKKNKTLYKEMGEMLFTHFGISGPLTLSASSHIQTMEKDRYCADIDLKPALSKEQLDARILRDFSQEKNRDIANSLGRLLPSSMIPIIIKRSGIPPETKVNSVTKEQRARLVDLLKCFRLYIDGFRPIEEAIITRGGVNVKEIDPKTMQSKLCEGVYFIGEVLDVDGYTGGFNLQTAFSTAYACAESIKNNGG